ncbi:MAG: formylglycine-generating enzyme family protein [Desulfobacterales bacterium]|nr:formylglycine-generating enzyme family protein [Desulfobacterales bacterium]
MKKIGSLLNIVLSISILIIYLSQTSDANAGNLSFEEVGNYQFEHNEDFRNSDNNPRDTRWIEISGTVKNSDGTSLCAMVLANGQHMFTCNPVGQYKLNVPLDENGQITLYTFCDGFASFKEILTPDETVIFEVTMLPAHPDSGKIDMTTVFDVAVTNPGWVKLSGTVSNEEGIPLCAMVLANGQHMFTCGKSNGKYEMEVPLGPDQKITLFAFCDGLLPSTIIFDSEDIFDTTDTTIKNSFGMTFKLISSGTFMMGSPEDEPGRWHWETLHQVTLTKPFYMQTTEVTQRQWKDVMGNNPSRFPNCGDDCPVDGVSWDDVQEFVTELNKRGEGTYRLPTEAEWEYAARAGSSSAFANGKITGSECGYDSNLNTIGWYCGNASVTYSGCADLSDWGGTSCEGIHQVAQKQPNSWGLYDMHGNVHEWCQDWFDYYPSSAVTDPVGPESGSKRVIRGGSWDNKTEWCRSAFRMNLKPDKQNSPVGFRLVRIP